MSEAQLAKVEDLDFESALKELDMIVRRLEDGRIKLDDAIKAYERGNALKGRCESLLNSAKMKVEKITKNESGDMIAQELELQ